MNPLVRCPCGGTSYGTCCLPLHLQQRQAETAEQLMRSRYSAFVVGDVDHLVRSWHPRTRPATVALDTDLTWTGLSITDTDAGQPGDRTGVVEFIARYRIGGDPGELHERSRFEFRAGRWWYLDGDIG